MKQQKNKASKCVILDAFPTLDILKEKIFIDLEKQEIINLSTGKALKQRIVDTGYLVVNFLSNGRSRNLKLHRLFFYWHNGYLPRLVDHIDRNRLNNNVHNLREVNSSENAINSTKREIINGKVASSKHKNVSFDKKSKKWIARPTLNGKSIYLGIFAEEDQAGEAVNQFYIKYNLTNFAVMNDTPQERARKINLFNEEKLSYS
jgi:hypothetical protein